MRRLAALLVAVLVLVVPTAVAAATRVYINVEPFGSHAVAKYKPRKLNGLTGDGTGFVTGISWRRWGRAQAYGSGTVHIDDCTPDCADGHIHAKPTHLHAYRIAYCAKAGHRIYTRLTVRGLKVSADGVYKLDQDC